AVEGTRAKFISLLRDHQASPIEGRTLDHQPVVICRPGAAADMVLLRRLRALSADAPMARPTGTFGDENRVRGAVGNLAQTHHPVDWHDPLVEPDRVNQAHVRQLGADPEDRRVVRTSAPGAVL